VVWELIFVIHWNGTEEPVFANGHEYQVKSRILGAGPVVLPTIPAIQEAENGKIDV
jgi:hypothetical protein